MFLDMALMFFPDFDDCKDNKCQHGGMCIDDINGYHCKCAPGYVGDYCDEGNYI